MLRHDAFDPALLDRLHECDGDLPPGLRGEILAHGERAIGPLRTLLSAGPAPARHAVRLIGEIGGEPALASLLQILRETDPDDVIQDDVIVQLALMGSDAIGPVLALFEVLPPLDDRRRIRCAEILVANRVRDPRILRVLRTLLDKDRLRAILLCGHYGDPAMLPDLARLFDDPRFVDPANPISVLATETLTEAIEALGGTLTEEQRAKCRAVTDAERRRQAMRRARTPRAERPGRNDPCWCGSGRKYKRCHLREDAAAPV